MNNIRRLSIKVIIPSVLFVLIFILQGSTFFWEFKQAQKKLYVDKEQYVKGIAGNLQASLSNSLMRREEAQAQQIVSVTALDPDFKCIAIVDNNQQIVLSDDFREKYMFAKLQLKSYDTSLLQQAIEKNEFIFKYNRISEELIAYAPLQIFSKSNNLNRKFNGAIFLRYSIKNAMTSLRYDALFSLIKISLILLIGLFILLYFIHHVVIQPLNKLTKATKITDFSQLIVDDKFAFGEIGILQQSFYQLAGKVHNHINKLFIREQRWLYALNGARDGVWDWDIEKDNVYFSPSWKELLGYQKQDVFNDIEEWESRIHGEDLFNVLQDLSFHFQGKKSFFENTHRIRCYNGQYRWILSRGQTVSWDADGQPLRIIGTITNVTQYKRAEEKIKQQAQVDEVTELPNRIQLLSRIEQEVIRSRQNKLHGAIIFMEFSQYKTINDLQGHSQGNQLLYLIARRLEQCCSIADFVAHLQGSEFVVVLPELHSDYERSAEIALQSAKKLERKLAEPLLLTEHRIVLSCSLGIELFSTKSGSADDLLRKSAMAMKNVKKDPISAIGFFVKEIEQKILARHILQEHMYSGLANNEFTLNFQPRINADGLLVGAEALLRWQNASQGWVSPVEFIPVAEECDLIFQLGDWVLLNAFEHLASWQLQGLPDSFTTLSINISPKQLLHKGFVKTLQWYLDKTKADPNLIEIEITENIFMTDTQLIINKLQILRALGVRCAIDDFGTGYSSFSYLSVLPVTTIKIDQSFISNLLDDTKQQLIVSAIIKMAESLKLEIVAEGVESQMQFDFLKEFGCTQFQGYLLAKPMPADDFKNLLFSETTLSTHLLAEPR